MSSPGRHLPLPSSYDADLVRHLAPDPSGRKPHLGALLRRWHFATTAAAAHTGRFAWDPREDPDTLATDAAEIHRLDATIRGLRSKARRERHPGPRAELNARLREARAHRAATLTRLP